MSVLARLSALMTFVLVGTLLAPLPAQAAPLTIISSPSEMRPGLPIPVEFELAPDAGDFYFHIDGQAVMPYDMVDVSAKGSGWVAVFPGIGTPGVHTLTVWANDRNGYSPVSTQVRILPGSFADVASSHVFLGPIEWLASTGITTGYTNGGGLTFRPSQPVLREQMAAFLYRLEKMLLGDVEPEVVLPEKSPFADVAPSHVFYREIVWLAQTGITTGYENADGTLTFRPSQPVLREQMAAFICRFDLDDPCTDLDIWEPAVFTDVPESHTFFDAIFFLASMGISTGYEEEDGSVTFRPSQPVLREQMAAFLYRYDNLGKYEGWS